MKTRMLVLTVLFLLASLALTGCSALGFGAEPTAAPTVTRYPTYKPYPTLTPYPTRTSAATYRPWPPLMPYPTYAPPPTPTRTTAHTGVLTCTDPPGQLGEMCASPDLPGGVFQKEVMPFVH